MHRHFQFRAVFVPELFGVEVVVVAPLADQLGVDEGELYDLAADPSETVNRWDDPTYAEVKTAMLMRLYDHMARTVDPLPPRVAPW